MAIYDRWLNRIVDKRIKEIQNKDVDQPTQANAQKIPKKTTRYRYRKVLQNWVTALQLAQRYEFPDWKYLLDIYRDLILDPKIDAKISNRKNKTILQDFKIYRGDEIDEELTEKFEMKWFRQFMDFTIDAKFYGFSLIQINEIIDDVPSSVELVDRYYINPDQKLIKTGLNTEQTGIPFDEGELADWNLWIQTYDPNKVGDMGMFSKIAQYFLYKKEVLSMYNEYLEVYGMPIRTANIGPQADINSVQNMMENLGANGWGIFPDGTAINLTESGTEHYDNIYQRLLDYLDDSISSIITGETLDNSTNYSQSKAFMKWADQASYMDNLFIQDVVNSQLFPMLVNLGLDMYKDARFEFYYKDEKTPEEQFAIESKLLEYYDIEPSYFENKYGVEIIGKKEFSDRQPLNHKKLDEFYKGGDPGDKEDN